ALRLLSRRRTRWRHVGTSRGGRDRQALVALVEQAVELLGLERLLLDELVHDQVELVAVLREHVVRAQSRALDDVVHLGVDDLRHVLRVVPLLLDLATEEDQLVALAVLQWPELLAHAELRDHLARHVRRLLDVVARAGRDVTAEVQLLRDPAAERRGDVVLELLARAEVAVLLRERPRDTHGHTAGDDRDLVHRVGVLEQLEAEGVAGLVVRHDPLLFFCDHTRATLVPVSKPSISTRIWLRVCSRSSCDPPRPAPRWRPTASISSMNTMHGALRLA